MILDSPKILLPPQIATRVHQLALLRPTDGDVLRDAIIERFPVITRDRLQRLAWDRLPLLMLNVEVEWYSAGANAWSAPSGIVSPMTVECIGGGGGGGFTKGGGGGGYGKYNAPTASGRSFTFNVANSVAIDVNGNNTVCTDNSNSATYTAYGGLGGVNGGTGGSATASNGGTIVLTYTGGNGNGFNYGGGGAGRTGNGGTPSGGGSPAGSGGGTNQAGNQAGGGGGYGGAGGYATGARGWAAVNYTIVLATTGFSSAFGSGFFRC